MFVGRVIPNKKFEDVIRAFHVYRTRHNPRSRLLLVGSYSGFETYLAMLTSLVARLGHAGRALPRPRLERGAHGALRRRRSLPLRERARGLLRADHRGLYKRVPVLAYAATAVPATMDGGGVLYETQGLRSRSRRLMEAVLERCRARGGRRRVAGRGAPAPARPRFLPARCCVSSIELLQSPPRQAPEVAFDFWAQFEQFERLEELRQFRPALYRALPDERRALMVINQWVPAAHRGDAIGDSARRVRDMLRAAGHQSDLFALTIDDDLRERRASVQRRRGAARRRHDLPLRPALADDRGVRQPARRAACCSITTSRRPRSSRRTTPQLFRLAALGRQELRSLAGRVDLALGDSEFNRQELEELGFARTGVMPIAVDIERLTGAPRRPALEKILADGHINILFVGRIVPNKRIEDHIRLAEVYKRYVDSYYRFIFVGRYDGVPRYFSMIQALDRRSIRCCRSASLHRRRCRTRTSPPTIGGPTPTSR